MLVLLLLLLFSSVPARAFAVQNPRYLNNGADVLFIYGDPTVGATAGSGQFDTSGDLYWMVWPRQSLISPSGTTEVFSVTFDLYDTDWNNGAPFYDMMFGPGIANPGAPGNIAPDFSAAGLAASTFVDMGGSSGLPNPCTVSPSSCSGLCPFVLVGYTVTVQFSGACDGSGIVLTANGSVDNVVTAFIPGGMTFSSAGPGTCGLGDYTMQSGASNDETQADTSPTPGTSRYGGFQVGASPGLYPDSVDERSIYDIAFCDPIVNTTIAGDRGTVGLHHDATGGSAGLQQVVADAAGLGQLCFVSNALFPPLSAPGIPLFGASLLLPPNDPTVTATLRKGIVAPASPVYGAAFVPSALSIPMLPPTTTLVLSSQALILDPVTFTARASLLTQTRINR